MFAWWGQAVVRWRWHVLAASTWVILIGAVWGTGVFGGLSGGGFDDPASPSSRAHAVIAEQLGGQSQDIVVLYSSPSFTVDEAEMKEPITAVLERLQGRPEVAQTRSYYDASLDALVSADRHATYIVVQLRDGTENDKLADLEAVRPLLIADGDVRTEVGGGIGFLDDANKQVESDIFAAELFSFPILLVLMLFIFRGVVAAAMPLLVGVLAIFGALTITRGLATITDVSVFAANIITILGLGMAIDYALFVVSRFREELARGHDPATAVARTVATAGRTVVVSGMTVAVALSGLLLFPMDFLKSMGYGAMAAVIVAMLASLTALPAMLAVLGTRINAIPMPRLARRRSVAGPAARRRSDGAQHAWRRLAHSVMESPLPYLVGVGVALVAMAVPMLRAEFGNGDERVLPIGTASRTVAERIAAEFPDGNVAPILAVLSGATPDTARSYADEVAARPDVTGAQVTASNGDTSLVTIAYPGDPTSAATRDLVETLRSAPPPAGSAVLIGGRTAADLDQVDSLADRTPLMALYVVAVTFLLLLVAFRSVVLPIKAILMNIVSIGASFGAVVWIFQDGLFADWLGFTPMGFLDPGNLIVMLVILFGLSTDYEIFLLSRVREEWDRTGDNTDAVAAGLQRTGSIITAAAALLIVVLAGLAAGGTATMKLLGLGTVFAVAIDAALVRPLLVPASMRLLGRWNWWTPRPLAALLDRVGRLEPSEPGGEESPPDVATANAQKRAPVGGTGYGPYRTDWTIGAVTTGVAGSFPDYASRSRRTWLSSDAYRSPLYTRHGHLDSDRFGAALDGHVDHLPGFHASQRSQEVFQRLDSVTAELGDHVTGTDSCGGGGSLRSDLPDEDAKICR